MGYTATVVRLTALYFVQTAWRARNLTWVNMVWT